MRTDVLVTAEDLAAALVDDDPPVLLDVRWALGRSGADARNRYLAGHLPGAVYVDLETELAAPPEPREGRHPLPPVAALEASARRWGLREGSSVVVYDDVAGISAARAWWLLRWAGIASVRLLDGGLEAWTADGRSVEAGEVVVEPGDVVLRPGALATIGADEAASWPAQGTLLDARAAERYAGVVEPVDPRAGHVPGAVSAPTWGNLGADGRFLPDDALRARFTGLAGPVAVYCGSGVTAAHEVAALAVVGVPAALYPGSWSAWSSDPARPVATGDAP